MADVILAKTESSVEEVVFRALDLLSYDWVSDPGSVVIKPNLCYYWDYSTGETTDPRVVSAIIDYVRARTSKDARIVVAEADGSAMRTRYAFKVLGYERLSSRKDVELLNLSEGETVETEVTVRGKKIALSVNKILLDSDLTINVPKLKYHRSVGLTCALKNIFGSIAVRRKAQYHSRLADVIVAVNKIVKSGITVVDGIIALGRYPKKLGTVIVGNDALAADIVAARILGYDPMSIGYLNLATEEKIGDPDNTNLVESNVKLEALKRDFPKQSFVLQNLSWKLQIRMLKTYTRLVGDVFPPILEMSA